MLNFFGISQSEDYGKKPTCKVMLKMLPFLDIETHVFMSQRKWQDYMNSITFCLVFQILALTRFISSWLTTEINFTIFVGCEDFQNVNFNPVVMVGVQNGLEIAFQSVHILIFSSRTCYRPLPSLWSLGFHCGPLNVGQMPTSNPIENPANQ